MVRASRVLNRQLMVALAALRSLTRASTSLLRASSPEEPLLQAGAGQDAELDLRHVQPTPVLGRVMKLQPPGNPPGFLSRESLVQRCPAMGIQIVQDNPYHLGFRVGFIRQPAHPAGEVLHRAPLRDRHLSPTRQGLAGQEQVAGTLPPVFVVLPQRKSRPGRQSGPGLRQQLGGCLVKANHRTLGIIGFGVEIQDILHVSHKFRAHLGNAPLLLLPRLKGVFLRRWRTPSWDMEGVSPNSTTFPASRRRVQWSCPSGGGLQAKAIRWASPRSSNFRGRLAWGRSCKTLSNPSSAKRCLTRYTVLRATSKASATWGAAQPSSLFRRIRALAVTRAEFLPTRISRWSSSRCSCASRTAYLSLTIIATPAINTSHQAG